MKNKFISLLLTLLLIFLFVSVQLTGFASVTDDNPNNVALGKTVTDVYEVSDHLSNIARLTDGDGQDGGASDRFLILSTKVADAVLEIDLEGEYTLSGVDVISGGNAFGSAENATDVLKAYQLQYLSGGQWLPIYIKSAMQFTANSSPGYRNIPASIRQDGSTVEVTFGFNFLSFQDEITTDKLRLVSKDINGSPKILREIRVYKAQEDSNVAYRKPTFTSHLGSGGGSTSTTVIQTPYYIVDGQSNNMYIQEYTFPGASSPMTTDHWVEIDLLDTYMINSAQISTGMPSGSGRTENFSLQAFTNGEFVDIPGASVTGNTEGDRTITFSPYMTNKVRLFLPKGQSSQRIREIKIYEAPPASIEFKEPSLFPMDTWDNNVYIETIIDDSGYGIDEIKVYNNGAELSSDDYQTDIDGHVYGFNISKLNSGLNLIKIQVTDSLGSVIYVEASVTVYDEEKILSDIKLSETKEELALLFAEYKSILEIDEDDLYDMVKWSFPYEQILSNLADYTSLPQLTQDFYFYALQDKFNRIINSENGDIYTSIEAEFDNIDWKDYEKITNKSSLQEKITEELTVLKDSLTLENTSEIEKEISKIIGRNTGIAYLKQTTWGNVNIILKDYKDDFDLQNYQEYSNLNSTQRSKADVYLMENKSSFNNTTQLDSVLKNAITEAKKAKAPSTGGGRPSGGGGGGGSTIIPGLPVITEPNHPIDVEALYSDLQGFEDEKLAVAYMSANKIVEGVGDNRFAPNDNLTREQFAKMLVMTFLSLDENAKTDFIDVHEGTWYYPYVATGVENNLINGFSDEIFGTGENVTREEMIVLIYRTLKNKGFEFSGNTKQFPDEGDIAMWALYDVKQVSTMDILKVNEKGELAPKEDVTRIEATKVLYDVLMILDQAGIN